MSAIETPWIDPLYLFDLCARGMTVGAPELELQAKVTANGETTYFARSAPRMGWLKHFFHEDAGNQVDDPVVTFVPVRMGTNWHWTDLHATQLTAWLLRMGEAGYDPTEPNVAVQIQRWMRFIANVRATPEDEIEGRRLGHEGLTVAKRALGAREFSMLIHAARHPTRGDSPSENTVIPPAALAQLFRVSSTTRFLPMTNLNPRGAYEMIGHATGTYTNGRHQWRQIQHHGWKPDAVFYGKPYEDAVVASREPADLALYAGVEVEMELPNSRQRSRMITGLFAAADGLGCYPSQRLHIETDSSVHGHGLEVVLMPHEVNSAQGEAFWKTMWETACTLGASNADGSAGMHIHVSAEPALRVHRFQNVPEGRNANDAYSPMVGLLIDMVTGLLAGTNQMFACAPFTQQHPQSLHRYAAALTQRTMDAFAVEDPTAASTLASTILWPYPTYASPGHSRNSDRSCSTDADRFATVAFGRPQSWNGGYAVTSICLRRRHAGMERGHDRYRHVNWANAHTIEFRLFGPMGFNMARCPNWINAATQLAAAIVGFSRWAAVDILTHGIRLPQAGSGEEFVDFLPRWLVSSLVVAPNAQAVDDIVLDGRRYCVQKPKRTSRGMGPWTIGLEDRDGTAEFSWQGDTPQQKHQRQVELYDAVVDCWIELLNWMGDQLPLYGDAYAYLQRVVMPHLPNAETMEAMLARVSSEARRRCRVQRAPARSVNAASDATPVVHGAVPAGAPDSALASTRVRGRTHASTVIDDGVPFGRSELTQRQRNEIVNQLYARRQQETEVRRRNRERDMTPMQNSLRGLRGGMSAAPPASRELEQAREQQAMLEDQLMRNMNRQLANAATDTGPIGLSNHLAQQNAGNAQRLMDEMMRAANSIPAVEMPLSWPRNGDVITVEGQQYRVNHNDVGGMTVSRAEPPTPPRPDPDADVTPY